MRSFVMMLSALALTACTAVVNKPLNHDQQVSITVRWQTNVGDMTPLLRPYITPDGTRICTVSGNGNARLLSAQNGNLLYSPTRLTDSRFSTITAGAGCDGEIVAAVDGDGWLYVHHFTNGLLWKKDLKTRVFGAPTVTKGRLLNIGLDGRLLAFTLKKGRELWRYVSPLENLMRTRLDSALTVSRNIVYGGIDNGAIVALNLSNGKILWENTISLPIGNNTVTNILDVTTPVVHGNTVCSTAYASGVACFGADNGERLWYYPLPAFTRAVFSHSGEQLFVTDADGVLYAFSATDGTLLWKKQLQGQISAPAVVNEMVVVGDENGVLKAYFADNGELGADAGLGTDDIISISAIPTAPDEVLVLSANGSLLRLSIQ